jgi:hypothetical protein
MGTQALEPTQPLVSALVVRLDADEVMGGVLADHV